MKGRMKGRRGRDGKGRRRRGAGDRVLREWGRGRRREGRREGRRRSGLWHSLGLR
jgi:hypothetical protein